MLVDKTGARLPSFYHIWKKINQGKWLILRVTLYKPCTTTCLANQFFLTDLAPPFCQKSTATWRVLISKSILWSRPSPGWAKFCFGTVHVYFSPLDTRNIDREVQSIHRSTRKSLKVRLVHLMIYLQHILIARQSVIAWNALRVDSNRQVGVVGRK